MPKLRTLSGQDLITIFGRFGFERHVQRGSHVKLRREQPGVHQTLTVVAHREVDKGTLLAIYRQALRFIAESELRPHFYAD